MLLDLGIDVAGDVEDVGEPVVVEVGQAAAPLDVAVLRGEAGDARHVLEQAAAGVAVERRDVVGKVHLQYVEPGVRVVVADREAHAGLRVAVFAECSAARDRAVGEGAVVVVAIEDGGGGVAGDVEVHPAVAVEVGGANGHRVALLRRRDARTLGDVAECAVRLLVEELLRLERHALWSAVDGDALPQAVRSLALLGGGREVELQVVRDEQVEAAVAVVVDEAAATAPAGCVRSEAALRGRVGEAAGAGIAEQPILAVRREVQVGAAVVVVVAGAGARRPSGRAEPRTRGDVLEAAAAAVAIEARHRRFGGAPRGERARARLQARAVHHQRVDEAVVVHVEPGDARAVRLDDEALLGFAAVDHRPRETRGLRHVHETHEPGRRGVGAGGGARAGGCQQRCAGQDQRRPHWRHWRFPGSGNALAAANSRAASSSLPSRCSACASR